jgi:thioredoxin-like negative regulator of GroEL
MKRAGVPVLVEFWKPGCGSCRALTRELEKLEIDVGGKLLEEILKQLRLTCKMSS